MPQLLQLKKGTWARNSQTYFKHYNPKNMHTHHVVPFWDKQYCVELRKSVRNKSGKSRHECDYIYKN